MICPSRANIAPVSYTHLSPAVALIGVGEHNRYGHPSQEVLDLLDASGCATYCSNEAGDVVVAFSEDTLTVSAQRQG